LAVLTVQAKNDSNPVKMWDIVAIVTKIWKYVHKIYYNSTCI